MHTQFFRKFISISPFSCLLTQSFCLTTLFPSVSTPPIQTTSPHISYSRCRNIFILRSSGYFPFTHSSQIFSRLFTKITYNISTELVLKHTCVCVCGTWWCTWLTMSPQCTFAVLTLQTALQLSWENGRIIAVLHIITDGTQTVDVHSNRMWNGREDTLYVWRKRAMLSRNYCYCRKTIIITYSERGSVCCVCVCVCGVCVCGVCMCVCVWCVGVYGVVCVCVCVSPYLSNMESALWPVLLYIILNIIS